MEVTLKKAVKLFCENDESLSTFKYYLKNSLRKTQSGDVILKEGEIIEVQDENITITFTWDMISAVNNITNKYVDLTTPENAYDVFN